MYIQLVTVLTLAVANIILISAFPQSNFNNKAPEAQMCLSPGCIHAASNVLKNINASRNPCDDFYKFACGGFMNRISIPADQSLVTSYTLIRDTVQEKLKSIVTEKFKPNESLPFFLMKQLYKTCFNRSGIDKKGLVTINRILDSVGGWPVVKGSDWNNGDFDWKKMVYKLQGIGYTASFILSVKIGTNPKNSSSRIINLDQPGLGLNQNYLLKGLEQDVVKAYYDYMVNVSVIFGANRSLAEEELKESLMFEIKLARISLSQENRRNVTSLYHPMTIEELQTKYKSIPWMEYIKTVLNVTIESNETVIVKVPEYFNRLETLLKEIPLRVQANYLAWRTVQNSVSFLTQELGKRRLEFNKVLRGVEERRHRSKECVEIVSNKLDLAVGALYARRYFDKDGKQKVIEMMSDIRGEFKKILRQIDWMDETTRESALEKVDVMTSYIAYADELYNNTLLEIYYSPLRLASNDYLLSILSISLFTRQKIVEKLRQPVLKTHWTTRASPSVVNAYYDALENSIEFPAGILQGAYFEYNRPSYLNYGAIGNVIGHEITHGFDDKGRQYDKNGNLIDWWAKETNTAYNQRTQCIIEQYNDNVIPELNLRLNGINTQGENIADNGGIKEAYLGYQEWVKRNGPELKLPGLDYTPNQLFWISAASPYCSKSRPEYLKLTVLTNPHSPDEFRVNIPFANNEYFAKDFNCPLGSKMNPERKCQVW